MEFLGAINANTGSRGATHAHVGLGVMRGSLGVWDGQRGV